MERNPVIAPSNGERWWQAGGLRLAVETKESRKLETSSKHPARTHLTPLPRDARVIPVNVWDVAKPPGVRPRLCWAAAMIITDGLSELLQVPKEVLQFLHHVHWQSLSIRR